MEAFQKVKKKNPQKYCEIKCMLIREYTCLIFKQLSTTNGKKIHLRWLLTILETKTIKYPKSFYLLTSLGYKM